jgi:hypothetical protein
VFEYYYYTRYSHARPCEDNIVTCIGRLFHTILRRIIRLDEFGQVFDFVVRLIRGRPLEIPGGGWKFPPKNSCKEKKIRAAITSEKKKSCKQTAKCKSVLKKNLAEVKRIKKNRAEIDMRLKKKSCRKNFIPPLTGLLMVRPLCVFSRGEALFVG